MEKFIIALDSQRLGAAQACLYKYKNRFIRNLDLSETSEAIKKGSFFHELLRYYYLGKSEIEPETIEEAMTGEIETPIAKMPAWENNLAPFPARDQAVQLARLKISEIGIDEADIIEVLATFHEYVDHYAGEQWKVLNVESPFSVILYENDIPLVVRGVEYSGVMILWEGIIDLEVEAHGSVFPVDHKTASRRNYPEPLNNQFMGYAFAKRSKMVNVNQIEFKKGADKFHRPFLSYPNHLIDAWVESVIDTVYGVLIPAIHKDKWSQNFHSCNQKFTCVFSDYCQADERTAEFLLKTKYRETKPWDPFSRDN